MERISVRDADFIKTLATRYKGHCLNGKEVDQQRSIDITPIYSSYSELSGVMISVNGSPPKAEFYIPLECSDQLDGEFYRIIQISRTKIKTWTRMDEGLFKVVQDFLSRHRIAKRISRFNNRTQV